jgi:hypothetical protein
MSEACDNFDAKRAPRDIDAVMLTTPPPMYAAQALPA